MNMQQTTAFTQDLSSEKILSTLSHAVTDILEMVAHLYVTSSLNQFQSIQLPYTDSAEEAVLDKTNCTATVTSALQRRSIVVSQILVRSRGIYTHKVLSVLLVVVPSFKNHIQAEQGWEQNVQRLQHT